MTHPIHSADAERAAFEHWARACDGNCNSDDLARNSFTSEYQSPLVQRDFDVWCAARAAAQVGANGAADWAQYLKEGETPLQRLEREVKDGDSLAGLLAAEKRKTLELQRVYDERGLQIGRLESAVDRLRAAGAPAETPPEYVPIYKNVIDHSGKMTGVEWVNAADAPKVSASDAPAETPKPVDAYKPGTWFDASTIDEMQAFYMARLPAIRETAKQHGYAIGLHGSTRRDFDLMAMQWRADASDKDTLAHAIAVAACGITRIGAYDWEAKPSGRFAVSLPICWTDHANCDFHNLLGAGHIDLSVIELATPAATIGAGEGKDALLAELCALLPGPYYMDPPDGGDTPVMEQIGRMALDAARYRWLRVNGNAQLNVMKTCAYANLDAAIDAAMRSKTSPGEAG